MLLQMIMIKTHCEQEGTCNVKLAELIHNILVQYSKSVFQCHAIVEFIQFFQSDVSDSRSCLFLVHMKNADLIFGLSVSVNVQEPF